MAEEAKKEEGGKGLATVLKILAGIILIVLGVVAIIGWWPSVLTLVKGCLGAILVLVGLVFIAIAKE